MSNLNEQQFHGTSETADISYRGIHRAPTDGIPMHQIDEAFPQVYDHPEWYDHTGDSRTEREGHSALSKTRGKPDASVNVYRAAPKGVGINPGDWVTASKRYAIEHAKHPTDPSKDMPVTSIRAKASELYTEGNSVHEFGYIPSDKK